MKLASFDIFDTTLIRRCGKPENIFYLMAQRLYPGDEEMQKKFVEWRKKRPMVVSSMRNEEPMVFEPLARKLGVRNVEVGLEDIYSQQSTINGLQLAEMEKEIESENLMVNLAIREVINQKRAEGWQIAFASDMYLDSEFLKEVLRLEGCFRDGDLIYVSCECGARKDLGTLYDLIRNELNPTEWNHWGDNKRSDVVMAKRKSVDAVWVDTTYTEAECGNILGGYQRAARISLGNNSFVSIAADFVVPAYVPYVLWILNCRQSIANSQQSTENIPLTPVGMLISSSSLQGIKQDSLPSALAANVGSPNLVEQFGGQSSKVRKLYFLSRDSYVLMKGAERLQKYFPDVEIHYLFLSRRSLLLPYLADDVSAERLLSVMDKQTIYGKRVDDLLVQLATTREELLQMGIEFSYNKIRNKADETDFLGKLFSGEYVVLLRERAKMAKSLLVRYFEQEGLLSGDRCDMVDVGWLGTSRLMVNKILDSVGAPWVRFFYYGVRGDVFSEECGEYITYFKAGELTTSATALIENYFSASPYPTTIGYKMDGDRVVPEFKGGAEFCDTDITRANREVVEQMIDWVMQLNFSDSKLREWAIRQLDIIVNVSSKIDLLPFVEANDFDSNSFVRKMTKKELLDFVCLGANVTAFDRMSLCLTVGYKYMNVLWRLHSWSGRFRRFLYLRFKHNR